MIIEIYFYDLTEEKQNELLEAYEILAPEEMNWDVFPVTQMEVYEEDENF